ncbi:MAG: ankyrin repeat domain-containing protein [Hyphomicrobiaceae bacterium]|nr:ankyrin repeat domain-containing protein [Hyphomicrobiaceae bacterium]
MDSNEIAALTKEYEELITNAPPGTTALFPACDMNKPQVAQYLIDRGTDVDAQNEDRYCALHVIAKGWGSLECAGILIKSGANVNLQTHNLMTPLHWAAATGKHELCELLLKSGANAAIENDEGNTPADLAKINYEQHGNADCGTVIDVFKLNGISSDETVTPPADSDEDVPVSEASELEILESNTFQQDAGRIPEEQLTEQDASELADEVISALTQIEKDPGSFKPEQISETEAKLKSLIDVTSLVSRKLSSGTNAELSSKVRQLTEYWEKFHERVRDEKLAEKARILQSSSESQSAQIPSFRAIAPWMIFAGVAIFLLIGIFAFKESGEAENAIKELEARQKVMSNEK